MESAETWGSTHSGILGQRPAAYFSAEFGIHESLPIYSGGLGVLAGDHLKSASRPGHPARSASDCSTSRAISRSGIDEQRLAAGVVHRDRHRQAADSAGPGQRRKAGRRLGHTRSGKLFARVWRVNVGRVRAVPARHRRPAEQRRRPRSDGPAVRRRPADPHPPGDHPGRRRRRALKALGIQPSVIHLNEGHSAFARLEFIRERMKEDGLSFDEALRETASMGVFTTHTPVPAGHDRFDADLVEEHLGPLARRAGHVARGPRGPGTRRSAEPARSRSA